MSPQIQLFHMVTAEENLVSSPKAAWFYVALFVAISFEEIGLIQFTRLWLSHL